MFAYYLLILFMAISNQTISDEAQPQFDITKPIASNEAIIHDQMLHTDNNIKHFATTPRLPITHPGTTDRINTKSTQPPQKIPLYTEQTKTLVDSFRDLAEKKFKNKSQARLDKYLGKVNALAKEYKQVIANPNELNNMTRIELEKMQDTVTRRLNAEKTYSRFGKNRSQTFIDDLTKLKEQIQIRLSSGLNIPMSNFFDLKNSLSPKAQQIMEPNADLQSLSPQDLEKLQQEITQKITDEKNKNGLVHDESNKLFLNALEKLETKIKNQQKINLETQKTNDETKKRQTDRNKAQQGDLNNYLADTAFTATQNQELGKPKESFNINDVDDPTITLLDQQLKDLENKSPQTDAIKAEIAEIKEQKQKLYQKLYQDTLQRIDTLESEQNSVNTNLQKIEHYKQQRTTKLNDIETNKTAIKSLTEEQIAQRQIITDNQKVLPKLRLDLTSIEKQLTECTQQLEQLQKSPQTYQDPEIIRQIQELSATREDLTDKLLQLHEQITKEETDNEPDNKTDNKINSASDVFNIVKNKAQDAAKTAQKLARKAQHNFITIPKLKEEQDQLQAEITKLSKQLQDLQEQAKPTYHPKIAQKIQEQETEFDRLTKEKQSIKDKITTTEYTITDARDTLNDNVKDSQIAQNAIERDQEALNNLPQPTDEELEARIQAELEASPNASAQERQQIRKEIETFPLVTKAELDARLKLIENQLSRLNLIRLPLEKASMPVVQP